jgi:hypothetical protein
MVRCRDGENMKTDTRKREPGNPQGKNQYSGQYGKTRGYRLEAEHDEAFDRACEVMGLSTTDAARKAINEWMLSVPSLG